MLIKAKFKGANGSLGYENGKNYRLRFRTESDNGEDFIFIQEVVKEQFNGAIISIRSGSYCPYSSLKAFLNNWQVF